MNSMSDRFNDEVSAQKDRLPSPRESFEGRDTALGQQHSLLASTADLSFELCDRLHNIERRFAGDNPTAECAQEETSRFDEHSALGALASETLRLRHTLMRMQEIIKTLDSLI